MTIPLEEKGKIFADLHNQDEPFVIANVFDANSAQMMAELGFKALATSSWVQAHMIGKADGEATREEALAHAAIIADSTELPVSGDLVNGFGDAPEDVATTIREAASIGLVGCSIEDASGNPDAPIYELSHAVERIEAAAESAANLPFKFTLTARNENYMNNISDMDDTIRRLQAFEAAGADVLMAPGLPNLEAVQTVCAKLNKPVNFMAGIPGRSYDIAELAVAGVARISLATSLYNVALGAIRDAAGEIINHGTFGYIND